MRYSKIIIFFILNILILSSLSVSIDALFLKNYSNDLKISGNDSDLKTYLIEFFDEPLAEYKNNIIENLKDKISTSSNNLMSSFFKEKISNYKNSLLSTHNTAENEIKNLLGRSNTENIFSSRFTLLLNGIVVDNVPSIIIDKIRNLSYVKSISPSSQLQNSLDGSVPLIGADKVWDLHDKLGKNITGKGVSIAFIDSGIDYTHPDLADNYKGGYDLFNNDNDPMDTDGHGTHCAGIAAGTGKHSGYQYVGVAPGADLYAYKIMQNDTGSDLDLITALEMATDPNGDMDTSDHLDIVSISLNIDPNLNPEGYGHPLDRMSLAIDRAVDSGILVVVSAGNQGSGEETIITPGTSRKAITVGATNDIDNIADFSSRGPVIWEEEGETKTMIKPNIVAPGVAITSTYPEHFDSYYRSVSGTSMSAPHVAGAVALLLQVHPEWEPDDIKKALYDTAIDIGENNNTQGAGRLDVLAAINLSSAPPKARLDLKDYYDKALIKINGTAMNGTGNPIDFESYSLFYKLKNDWIKIHEGYSEVNNSILYSWDTTNLESGYYQIKLFVESKDQASFEIKEVNIGYEYITIQCNDTIFEKECFNVKILNQIEEEVPALVVFLSSFRLPQIKYGGKVNFTAPKIINPLITTKKAKIIVIKLFPTFYERKEIIISK